MNRKTPVSVCLFWHSWQSRFFFAFTYLLDTEIPPQTI